MKAPVLALLFTLLAGIASSQQPDPRTNAVNTVVQGYNEQNYAKMKKPWGFIGRVLVPKSMLRKEYKPLYERAGRATIDTIYRSKYSYTVKLNMEKSKGRVYWQFIFNEKGRIQGFGDGYPPLVYRKSSLPKFTNMPVEYKIDSVIRSRYVKGKPNDFNGSVLVADVGEPVYSNSFGFADYNKGTRLNDTSLFELASCSKQFTAFAILLLEKKGKLKVSDSVRQFLPDLPYYGITIEHLLTHTSGLPDYERLLDKTWDKSKFATNADVLESFKKHKPPVAFRPGERFEYSNAGYVLLSIIIEKVSGTSYAKYLETSIFRPLGMRFTRVYNTRRSKNEKLDNYAYGYVYSRKLKRYVLPDSVKEYDEVIYQDAITGDGTVNSCTRDLLIWERSLLNYRLLDKPTLQRMYTRFRLNNGNLVDYGYGVFIHEGDGLEKLVFHSGGWPGYRCMIMRSVGKSVIVLSNTEYPHTITMADDIMAFLLGNK